MSVIAFISTFEPILKNDGTVNDSGTLNFYSPETALAIPKAVYSDAKLTTSLGNSVTLDSAGRATVFLNGNYDLRVLDSAAATVYTRYDINPEVDSATTESNLIVNGSFEYIANGLPTGWVLTEWNTSANVVDSTAGNQKHGLYGMKFVSTGNGGGTLTTSYYFPVNQSIQVEVGWFMKSSAATVQNIIEILWYDKDKIALGTPSTILYNAATGNPSDWTEYVYTTSPLSGAYWAKLKITGCHSSSSTVGNTWFDDVRVNTIGLRGTLSTAGSLIYGATAYTPTTLSIGAEGEVLTVVGAQPGWEASASPGESLYLYNNYT
jgi:hypothetical protein